MAARIDNADLPKLARAAGTAGKPEPAWAKDDPDLHAAYRAGAGLADDTPPPAVKHPQSNPARKPSSSSPSRSKSARKPTGKKQFDTVTSAGKGLGQLIAHPTRPGAGAGGGLMLAVILYPMLLATLQNGPAGLKSWLAAKLFNNPGTRPTSYSPPAAEGKQAGGTTGKRPQ